MAKVIIKSAFTLITDDHRRHEFVAGEQNISDELADHWYVKAHCEPEYDVPVVAEAVAETSDEPAQVAEPRKTIKAKK